MVKIKNPKTGKYEEVDDYHYLDVTGHFPHYDLPDTYGVKELPRIRFKGKEYFVDFRLGEMRDVETALPIKFTELKGGKDSPIKKGLRGLRSRTWHMEYIHGLDD